MILPLISYFTPENVKNFVEAISNNRHGQILYAAGSEQIIEAVYDDTANLLEKTKKYWIKILQSFERDEDKYESLIKKIKMTDNIFFTDNPS